MSGGAGFVAMAYWDDGISVITGSDLQSVLMSLAKVLVAGQDGYCLGVVSDLGAFLSSAKATLDRLEKNRDERTREAMEELRERIAPLSDVDTRYGDVLQVSL